MSQEKVDYHKQQKQNRKKIVKRQKAEHIAILCASLALLVVLGVWVGFSVNTKYQEKKAANPTYYEIDASALSEYMSGLQQ